MKQCIRSPVAAGDAGAMSDGFICLICDEVRLSGVANVSRNVSCCTARRRLKGESVVKRVRVLLPKRVEDVLFDVGGGKLCSICKAVLVLKHDLRLLIVLCLLCGVFVTSTLLARQ